MKTSNILWGLALIIVGVLIGLNQFDLININLFFEGWWTLFIIVPCAISFFTTNDKVGDLIGIIIGTLLLLACQDVISFSLILKLLLPVILVIVGISIIYKSIVISENRKKIKNIGNNKNFFATFGSQKLNYDNQKLENLNATAVFGGIDFDLRDAIIKDDIELNLQAIFGGIDVIVPKDVKVVVNSIPIFGGVESKYKSPKDATKTIYINALCVFGGVEIK